VEQVSPQPHNQRPISQAEIAGISAANVGTKIHRLKKVLIRGVREGGTNV
jgi:hypothetical protein